METKINPNAVPLPPTLKIWEHPWFWFAIVTVIYWVSTFFGGTALGILLEYVRFREIIGLFTPIGPLSILATNIYIPGTIIGLIVGEFLLKALKVRGRRAIIFSLVMLLVITLFCDLVALGHWESFNILLGKPTIPSIT
ncbi:MAG: hypothetical protein JWO40_112 [Candidatus Doudnabacteria bacterium]|nr:hypothetical protein [Candidatus Doudnabacteria bacterium]